MGNIFLPSNVRLVFEKKDHVLDKLLSQGFLY